MDLINKLINKDVDKNVIDMSANHILSYLYVPPLTLLPQEIKNFENFEFEPLVLNRNDNGINYKQIKLATTQNIRARLSLFKNSVLATSIEYSYSLISPDTKNFVLAYGCFLMQFDFSLNSISFYYNGMINLLPSGTSFSNEGQRNYELAFVFGKKITIFGANQIGRLLWRKYVY